MQFIPLEEIMKSAASNEKPLNYDSPQSIVSENIILKMGTTTNDTQNSTTTFQPNILGWVVTGFSIVILILWVRWLYNTGSPKES